MYVYMYIQIIHIHGGTTKSSDPKWEEFMDWRFPELSPPFRRFRAWTPAQQSKVFNKVKGVGASGLRSLEFRV